MSISNRVTLAQLNKMESAEVNSLPVDQIAMLLEDVAEREACTKRAKDKLTATLASRYSAPAQIKRKATGKDTGTVHLVDGDFDVKADLPKDVKWDQAALAALQVTIRDAWKRDPAEYIKATFTVEEKKYEAWPSDLRALFTPARTLGVGKPKFDLTPRKEAA